MLRTLLKITGNLLIAFLSFHSFAQSPTKPKVEVFVFLGSECPISQKYMSRLNDIATKYDASVKWTGLIAENVKVSLVKKFAQEYNAKFPIKKDDSFTLVQKYGAEITPEVFVVVDGKVKYKGAIDNWFYELGRYRTETTEHYLVNALSAILKGEDPSVKETEPIGCLIEVPSSEKNSAPHHH